MRWWTSYAPAVELFSRQERKGWQVFGNQTDKFLPLLAGEAVSREDDEEE
jgi:N6-adenosine-specific RNA methylase IME4